jgi:electron transport complex protein RnfG
MRASEVLVPQFRERTAESFVVTKSGATMDNEIDAITSATITSKAYTGAVNTSLHYFDLMNGGEN